jgi:hypothetical protein
VLPVLGREVVEGQQFSAVFDQLGDGLLILHTADSTRQCNMLVMA